MRKIDSLSLASDNATQTLLRGKVELPRGKKMVGLWAKTTFPVANATGGTLSTGLTDAQRQTTLACLKWTVRYGAKSQRAPFANVDGARLHREARFALGSELEGYADTTTGFARSMANSATTNAIVWQYIPLGRLWWLPEAPLGMGRSQALSLSVEVRRVSSAIDTNITLSGAVSVDFFPDERPAKGDRWAPVPEYMEDDTTAKSYVFPDGLPLRVSERTAVHASSALTSFSVYIDDEPLRRQLSAAEALIQYNDSANVPSAASLADREVLLYVPPYPQPLATIPSGRVRFEQDTKDLATAKLSLLYLPIISYEELAGEYAWAVANVRNKAIRAVSLAAHDRLLDLPARLHAFLGAALVDEDDREWEEIAGVAVAPGKAADIVVPGGVLDRARALYSHHKGRGEAKAAARIVDELALQVPGAVQSGRGFRRGSSEVRARISAFFG